MMGKLVGVSELGVYSVAVLLSGALSGAVKTVINGVVFPALAAVKERGRRPLKKAYYQIRKGLDFTVLPALGAISALGPLIVDLLFDPRYSDAGWMLQLLVLRDAMICILVPCQTCLFTVGRVRLASLQGIGRALWLALAVPAGFTLLGVKGVVIAVALSELPVLLLLWPAFHQEKLFSWILETRSIALFLVGFILALILRPALWRLLF